MKIVIVGAGVSGLTAYLFLKKLLPLALPPNVPVEFVIFEKHHAAAEKGHASGSTTVGGALGIAPNGLHVLRDLDQHLFQKVVAQGYSVSHFGMRNAHGWNIARFPATDFSNPPIHTVLISRQKFWDCLRESVPDDAIVHANISEVACRERQRPRIKFADASTDVEVDLIIGADGVRSVVKRVVTGDGKQDSLPAIFEGLVGVGGFIPATTLSPNYPSDQLTLTFGSHGFFGYGPCCLIPEADQIQYGSNRADRIPSTLAKDAVWWSTYQLDHLPETANIDFEDIKAQLQQRHSNFKDPTIQTIIANVNLDSIYPIWTTPSLPTWSNSNVVLVGDAAHALQTSSGQGASQALEDAQVLAMLLAHYLCQANPQLQIENGITLALKQYVELRKPRVERIAERAKIMGDMKRKKGMVEEWVTYFFIWAMGVLPRKWNSYDLFLLGELPGEKVREFLAREDEARGR